MITSPLWLLSSTLLFVSHCSVRGFEDSDIIPIRVLGRPESGKDYDRTSVRVNSEGRANRKDEGLVTSKCAKCLCYASTKCKALGCENLGKDAYFCGSFQASWAFWSDGGKPTVPGGLQSDHKLAFEECLKDYKCSSKAVTGYMTKHQQDCNGDGAIDCYDFAVIHKAGPYSCEAESVQHLPYWDRFLDCMDDKVDVDIPTGQQHSSKPAERPRNRNRDPPKESFEDRSEPVEYTPPSSKVVDSECLKCLCYANSKCEARGCTGSANICGPFQATWVYWADGGKPTVPGGLAVDHPHSFEECLKDYDCASEAVNGYMKKHYKNCDGEYQVDCYDFAKIHKGGPNSCPTNWLENQEYWKRFQDCMNGRVDVTIPRGNAPSKKKEVAHQPSLSTRETDVVSSSSSSSQSGSANLDDKCLKCICHASTKCQAKGCLNTGPESYFCGPFQATWVYWSDGGKPTVPGGLGSDHKHAFEECLKDYDCASRAVKGYMKKHKQNCDSNRQINCYDFARIHKAGPTSCSASWVEGQEYWDQFVECMEDKVDVSIPGEEVKKEKEPSYSNNDRDSSYLNWQPPPEAGPYKAPATSRPQSNARLPPFAQSNYNDAPTYSDSPSSRDEEPVDRYQPEPSNRRRPSTHNRRKQNSSNRRKQPATEVQGEAVTEKCLQCLCYASSQCEALGCFEGSDKTKFCGPFQATLAYWKEAGSPTVPGGLSKNHEDAYQECLKDYDCATETVEKYMKRYKKDCDNDHQTNCYDFARIHKLGPYSCGGSEIEYTEYWNRLKDCMDGYVTFE